MKFLVIKAKKDRTLSVHKLNGLNVEKEKQPKLDFSCLKGRFANESSKNQSSAPSSFSYNNNLNRKKLERLAPC